MRKNIFTLLLFVLATMIGCQEGIHTDEGVTAKQITITANIDGADNSRVSLTPDTDNGNPIVKVDWKESGESFRMWGGNSYQTFTQTSGNQFSGTLPESADGNYYASYPANENVKVANGAITFEASLFTSQDGKLSEARTVMGAQMSEGVQSLDFSHVTTLLKPAFKIDGAKISADKIQTITFKDMLVVGGTADFTIDCTSHQSSDDIYVYLPNVASQSYGNGKSVIDMVVTTRDAKTYVGRINVVVELVAGKLYTVTISLISQNVITYTTSNGTALNLNSLDATYAFENGVGTITLAEGVTSIPQHGMYDIDNLLSINLPSTITEIGAGGLAENRALTSINLAYVTRLGSQALQNATSLTQVTMPKNAYTIGTQCFYGCTSLTEINLTKATEIGYGAFNYCSNLQTVIVDNVNPIYVTNYIFSNCHSDLKIYVPDSAVDSYKTRWYLYAAKITPMSELQK